MPDQTWHPYHPDQQFGIRVAADAAVLDRLLALFDARPTDLLRAANKAPVAGVASVERARWSAPWGAPVDPLAGPCTTATALDAAPRVRSDG
jgi:hypothetical protein